MYLYRRRYVQDWDHAHDDARTKVTLTIGGKPVELMNPVYIIEQVGYWRKANAIHSWFVENVQGGVDDCGTYDVEREHLVRLRDLCQEVINAAEMVDANVHVGTRYTPDGGVQDLLERGTVIKDPAFAHDHLPSTSGFFFGSTEYDQFYVENLKNTITICNAALEDSSSDCEYHSSW